MSARGARLKQNAPRITKAAHKFFAIGVRNNAPFKINATFTNISNS